MRAVLLVLVFEAWLACWVGAAGLLVHLVAMARGRHQEPGSWPRRPGPGIVAPLLVVLAAPTLAYGTMLWVWTGTRSGAPVTATPLLLFGVLALVTAGVVVRRS